MSGVVERSCRFCGLVGPEDEGDPFPGTCPDCLAPRLEAADRAFVAAVERLGPAASSGLAGLDAAIAGMVEQLAALGATRATIDDYLEQVNAAFGPPGTESGSAAHEGADRRVLLVWGVDGRVRVLRPEA